MPYDSDTARRFMGKVRKDVETGCWLWTASTRGKGYGRFYFADQMVQAHRWSYEHHIGPIPADLQIDHLCCVKICVNPEHLEPVTSRENNHRSLRSRGIEPGRPMYGPPAPPTQRRVRVCSVEGCDRPYEARGLCKMHWKRWRRAQDDRPRERPRPRVRVLRKPRQRITHCKHGHPYDDENSRWDKHGRRHCRACENAKRKRYPRRRVEAA